MKRLFLIFCVFFVTTCAQTSDKEPVVKKHPEHRLEITNPELNQIVDEFFRIGKTQGVTFSETVSIGFVDLKKTRRKAIGLCTYGSGWREIDLDENYWKGATWLNKIALLYHELAHCYCDRSHDWADKKMYYDPETQFFMDIFNPERIPMSLIRTPPGFFDDGCAMSLMHPTIIDDDCTKKHYDHYVREMFERCDPY